MVALSVLRAPVRGDEGEPDRLLLMGGIRSVLTSKHIALSMAWQWLFDLA